MCLLRWRALLVGATMTAAVPAQAQAENGPSWPLTCLREGTLPAPGTVYVDSEGLHIDLESAGTDVEALSQYAADKVLFAAACLVEPVPTEPAFCLREVVRGVDSYFNVSGTHVDICYPMLVDHVLSCASAL